MRVGKCIKSYCDRALMELELNGELKNIGSKGSSSIYQFDLGL